MKKLSVILPCFNESKNLPYVLEKFGKVINSDDIELIIVDNGSEDNTLKILEELIPKYSFAKLEKVKVNKGYGYGIKSGLKVAQGKYLSWTHADMQTDPNDVIKALNLIENCSSRDKLFIKGKRKGRPWSDEFFTIGMSFFESILLLTPLWDINAQPNVFSRELFDNLKCAPDDFSFDLFYYYLAVKNNYKIIRFEVSFRKRYYGQSSWNINWLSKIKFIARTVKFTFKLILKINFSNKLNYRI